MLLKHTPPLLTAVHKLATFRLGNLTRTRAQKHCLVRSLPGSCVPLRVLVTPPLLCVLHQYTTKSKVE